jgi:hypothetical protein
MKLIAAFLFVGLAVAQASIIYVSDGTNLYDINPITAAVVGEVTLGEPNLAAMTIGPDGTLYGLFGGTQTEATLGVINPGNGDVTLASSAAGLDGQGLAFDTSGDLYGFVSVVVQEAPETEIVAIDPTSGVAGSSFACAVGGHSLAFSNTNTAYVVEGTTLVTVSQNPVQCGGFGVSAQVPSFGSEAPGGPPGGPTGPDNSNSGLLDISNGGTYFDGILSTGSGSPSLVTFNDSTYISQGTENVVGNLPDGVDVIAASHSSVTPEPSAGVLMCLGVGSMVFWLRYRRRAQ